MCVCCLFLLHHHHSTSFRTEEKGALNTASKRAFGEREREERSPEAKAGAPPSPWLILCMPDAHFLFSSLSPSLLPPASSFGVVVQNFVGVGESRLYCSSTCSGTDIQPSVYVVHISAMRVAMSCQGCLFQFVGYAAWYCLHRVAEKSVLMKTFRKMYQLYVL